jgi:hypothetical protein
MGTQLEYLGGKGHSGIELAPHVAAEGLYICVQEGFDTATNVNTKRHVALSHLNKTCLQLN